MGLRRCKKIGDALAGCPRLAGSAVLQREIGKDSPCARLGREPLAILVMSSLAEATA